jgi:large subunit ribosomal protein L2
MAIKRFKPVTPGTRFKVANTFSELTAGTPEKSLLAPMKSSGGRNNSGKMTMRYTGGGHKRRYRLVDFKRTRAGIPAVVKTVEYDPNRSAFISLIAYADGVKAYILAPKGIQVGQTVISGKGSAPETGNALPLSEVPLGSNVHNIEMNPGAGGVLARSAGSYATLTARDGKYAVLRMPSGELRMELITCLATM